LGVAAVPEVRVLGFNASAVSAPPGAPPSSPPPPVNTTLNLPAPPALPSFPSATPLSLPPPAPPAPPIPPTGQTASGLTVPINLTGVLVPPTPGFTAQPTPPVNPAPPGGARKEARQKQAATAKSEEGGAGEKASDATGGLAESPIGPPGSTSAMTRRDRARAEAGSFGMVHHEQASARVTGLQWGGGIAAMALILALGFTTLRPTPRGRRRPGPDIRPAPAWTPTRRR
jgi:hypothetical protein